MRTYEPATATENFVPARRGYTFNYLHRAGFEETAAAVRMDSRVSPGCGFARKMHKSRRSWPAKDSARSWVSRMYAPLLFPGPLKILTLPGLKWPWERLCLAIRGTEKLTTEIYSLENEPAIYKASLQFIPGGANGISCTGGRTFVSTSKIVHYELSSFEKFIEDGLCPQLDGAWLDFTGFITQRRLEALKALWSILSHSLTITSLKARHEFEVGQKIKKHGGIGMWLAQELGAYSVADEREYCEGIPMHQITFRKIPGSLSL